MQLAGTRGCIAPPVCAGGRGNLDSGAIDSEGIVARLALRIIGHGEVECGGCLHLGEAQQIALAGLDLKAVSVAVAQDGDGLLGRCGGLETLDGGRVDAHVGGSHGSPRALGGTIHIVLGVADGEIVGADSQLEGIAGAVALLQLLQRGGQGVALVGLGIGDADDIVVARLDLGVDIGLADVEGCGAVGGAEETDI